MVGFGSSDVELSGSATTELVVNMRVSNKPLLQIYVETVGTT
jgi:hypothetical protein